MSRLVSLSIFAAVLAAAFTSGVTGFAFAVIPRPSPHAAPTTYTSVTLEVHSSRDSRSPNGPRFNAAVNSYRWLINLDNTGEPYQPLADLYCHPSSNITLTAAAPAGGVLGVTYVRTQNGYPQGCEWPSIRYAVASPALTEGTQADWASTKPLPVGGTYGALGVTGLPQVCPTVSDPNHSCRYLVTVMADGYQIGGTHFTVPSLTPTVTVYLNPYPLPLGTIRLKAFADISPTDGTYDEGTEHGLVGFHGLLNDMDGIIQADYFGNPLCTEYLQYQASDPTGPAYTLDLSLVGSIVLNANTGRPTPLPAHDPAAPDPKTGYYNPTVPGDCLSDTNGEIVIPNMAPNHYSANVTPPIGDANNWIQTTTLEGNHDFDVWTMPNDTGLDTELVVGGEPVSFVQFGFTPATPQPNSWLCPAGGTVGQTSGCGRVTGQLYQANTYVPGYGALPGVGGANGTAGIKLQNPIDRGWVTLNNLNTSSGDFDTMVATIPTQDPSRPGLQYPDCPAAPTNANPTTAGWGCFEFTNVPDGEYLVTIWDEPQDTALDRFNASISNGQIINMGVLPLLGWFSHISGKVCVDTNGNGRCDAGDNGIPQQTVQNLNRTNNSMVGGINTSNTDNNGYYDFREAYPLGLMSINQFFFTRYKTTGITSQACNDPQEHTVIGPMVDISYLPIIGQCGRIDWAVQPYTPSANGDNGGIVATMREDYTREKYNARQAQSNDYMTGIPGFTFEQYTPIKGAGPGGTDYRTGYALAADESLCTVEGASLGLVVQPNGSPATCGSYTNPELQYISENAGPPAQCYPQDANGKPIGYIAGNVNSYDFMVSGGACIEATASGTQVGLGADGAHGVQTVDGNYGLGNWASIPSANTGDTLVHVRVPVDNVLPAGYCYNLATPGVIYGPPCKAGDTLSSDPRPLYSWTTEEQTNFFSGPQFIPQGSDTSALVWPPNPGPAKQMPNNLSKPDAGYDENPYTMSPGPDPQCAGNTHVVHVTNPTLLANGGSPFEGAKRHLCDTLLLDVQAGISIAPDFHAHTVVDVPLPAHFWGYIVDDISVETNKKSANLGEVHGLPYVPVGVYDWTGRRLYNANSDYNGVWELLMPSSDIVNCLTPAQVCPNVYRFVGNDPGQPGHPNLNYNSNYRTIAANFEAWPNMLIPADTAPTKVVTGLEGPAAQFNSLSPCGIAAAEPQMFAVGPDPYIRPNGNARTVLTISGANFAARGAASAVRYTSDSGNVVTLPIQSWADHTITVQVGAFVDQGSGGVGGSGTITVTNASGLTSAAGIGFHVLGSRYSPHVVTVGPGKQFDPFPQLLTHLTAPINPGAVDHISVNSLPYSIGFGDTVQVTVNGHTLSMAASNPEIAGEQGVVPANPIPQGATEIDIDQSASSKYTFPTGTPVTLIRNYAVQDALDFAGYSWQAFWANHSHNRNNASNQWLVVVYPRWDSSPSGQYNQEFVPLGTYFENVIIHSPLKLQGVGPGGIYPDATVVQGSILDGRYWSAITNGLTDIAQPPEAGQALETAVLTPAEPATVHWTAIADYLNMIGVGFNPGSVAAPLTEGDGITGADLEEGVGAVVTEVSLTGTQPTNALFAPAVDGFTITGGDQGDLPGNITEISGTRTGTFAEGTEAGNTQRANPSGDVTGAVSVQGGAVFVHGGTDNFRLTDNLIRQNSGTYGSVRFGTLFQGDPGLTGGADHNYNSVVSHNVLAFNGGTNLAGAVGIFDDTYNYSIDHNTFCMNASAEYGGAISHYGFSPGGNISYNRIFLNSAFDEGGAITIAGEPGYRLYNNRVAIVPTPDPTVFTQGTGAVTVDHNYISDNYSHDDGGAFRIMGTAGTGARVGTPPPGGDVDDATGGTIPVTTAGKPDLGHISLTNNVISNNVSGHEGGAVSIADTPFIDIVNNTITQNVTTATATTSNGLPSPGGIAVDINSAGLNKFLSDKTAQIPAWMNSTTWPSFSNPRILNDILWYNRAGSWGAAAGVMNIGLPGDTSALNFWDVGSSDAAVLLTVSHSVIGSAAAAAGQQYIDGGGNRSAAPPANMLCQNNQLNADGTANANWCGTGAYNYPHLTNPYATILSIAQQRTYFRFRPAAIVAIDLPTTLFDISTYRIGAGSPAQNVGSNPTGSGSAVPRNDIENRLRPNPPNAVDGGAYQLVPRAGLVRTTFQ